MSVVGTVRRVPPRVSWWRRVAGFILPVLLAFLAMVAAWIDPVAEWIAYRVAWGREVLPRGTYWSLTGDVSSVNLFSLLQGEGGWSGFFRWFDSTPWPALIIVFIATARMAVWSATRRLIRPVEESEGARTAGLRFGGDAESMALIAWTAAGAVAWRFQWGLTWDHPVTAWFPTSDGLVAIGLLWLGAALGYAWTIAVLERRLARRDGERYCVGCGYPLRGLPVDQRCPECGHDPKEGTPGAMRRLAAMARRSWPLAAALLFLGAPYLSTLLASLVNLLRSL